MDALRFPSDVSGMRGMYIRIYGVDVSTPKDVVGGGAGKTITALATGVAKFGVTVAGSFDMAALKDVEGGLKKVLPEVSGAVGSFAAAIPSAITSLNTSLTNIYPVINKALIFLPMPMEVTTSYNASWSGNNLNPVEYAIRESQKGMSSKDATDLLARNLVLASTEAAISTVSSAMNVSRARGLVKSLGKVWNPYIELMYDSPNLRTFNYDWTFSPKSQKEAFELNKIIYILKKAMHPIVPDGNAGSSVIWEYPDYADLTFINNTQQDTTSVGQEVGSGSSMDANTWLFKMLKCAISSVTVHYDTKFHPDGSPVSISLQLSFMETELITQASYPDAPSGNRYTP